MQEIIVALFPFHFLQDVGESCIVNSKYKALLSVTGEDYMLEYW
jgi:hypothetical protein